VHSAVQVIQPERNGEKYENKPTAYCVKIKDIYIYIRIHFDVLLSFHLDCLYVRRYILQRRVKKDVQRL